MIPESAVKMFPCNSRRQQNSVNVGFYTCSYHYGCRPTYMRKRSWIPLCPKTPWFDQIQFTLSCLQAVVINPCRYSPSQTSPLRIYSISDLITNSDVMDMTIISSSQL